MSSKKILYALQGTGNGHVARAREIIPLLQKYGEVDVWLGGNQSEVALPVTPKFRVRGFVMKYNKKGGLSFWRTVFGNNYFAILRDVLRAPVRKYDLILNDFECITAWSCRLKNKKCIQISHQAAFWEKSTPRPVTKNWFGEFVLKNYATGSEFYGFHFQPDYKTIFPPVIRQEIRSLPPRQNAHYTVYLPAYHHEYLVEYFSSFYKEEWEVFSKFATKEEKIHNVTIKPITNEAFLQSLSGCLGVLCGAGFETPAEAMYLGKKLAVVPIGKQYEQYCNAAALQKEGALVLPNLCKETRRDIRAWIKLPMPAPKNYPVFIEELLKSIVNNTPKPQKMR